MQLTIKEILELHHHESKTKSNEEEAWPPLTTENDCHHQHTNSSGGGGHQDKKKKNIAACIQEIKAFVRGDVPGLARLAEVYPSILLHFKIHTDALYYRVMHDAGVPWDTCKAWRLPSDIHQAARAAART